MHTIARIEISILNIAEEKISCQKGKNLFFSETFVVGADGEDIDDVIFNNK